MKSLSFLTLLLLSGATVLAEAESPKVLRRDPCPPASTLSQDLFWIADTRKMDLFLAEIDLASLRQGSYSGEVLPDTRVAWRDYSRQARNLAGKGDDAAAIFRIWQMLKLAAVYREFGGLQNVAQGEEIRTLAGQTAQALGYGGRIHSPYLEYKVEECVALLERQAGMDKHEVRPVFWQHLIESARDSHARLSGQPVAALATASDSIAISQLRPSAAE